MLTESNEVSGLRHSKPLSTTQLCVGVPPPASAAPQSLSLKPAAGIAPTVPSLRLLCTSTTAGSSDSSTAARWVAPGTGGPPRPGAEGSRSWRWGPTPPPHLMVRGGGGCANAPPARTPGPLRPAKASGVARVARGGAF